VASDAIAFGLVTGIARRHLPREMGCSGVIAWRRLRKRQQAGCASSAAGDLVGSAAPELHEAFTHLGCAIMCRRRLRLRARGLRRGAQPDPPPEWGLYLLGSEPSPTPWPARWLTWPDFGLPRSLEDAESAFADAYARAATGARVEIACGGGRGRTGTALACIARIAGVDADHAVAWVREHYDPRSVETPWQRRYVRRFEPPVARPF